MKKLTNIEKVRQYDIKNGHTTVRQAGADLDLTPQQVYQIRYALNKKAEKSWKLLAVKAGSSDLIDKIMVPKEWEEDAQQMAEAIKTAPVEREATALADPNVDLRLKNTQLNVELARANIIIKYLEDRVEELSVRR